MFAAFAPWTGLRPLARALGAVAFCLLAGCATVPNGGDPRDPYESWNRQVFEFNEGFDEAIAKPIATGYRDLLPFEVRVRVRNFFSNIQDLMIGVNNLLQGKPADAWSDWTRFVINSTIGLFGLHDIASEAGLEKHNEDFGQTFAVWGAEEGPYLVWPFLGGRAHALDDQRCRGAMGFVGTVPGQRARRSARREDHSRRVGDRQVRGAARFLLRASARLDLRRKCAASAT